MEKRKLKKNNFNNFYMYINIIIYYLILKKIIFVINNLNNFCMSYKEPTQFRIKENYFTWYIKLYFEYSKSCKFKIEIQTNIIFNKKLHSKHLISVLKALRSAIVTLIF